MRSESTMMKRMIGTSVAPRSFAFIGQRKPTGCASAMFEPMMSMQSAFARSC